MNQSLRKPHCILLDIEGTTSSISFVYDVMFPFIRKNLATYVQQHWNAPDVADCLPLLAVDLGIESVDSWLGKCQAELAQNKVVAAVSKLMDDDVKATGLKKLQGAIWKDGFESGELTAHLFDDVADAIKCWMVSGIQIKIYSSGSVQAQQLFFGHTVAGNLLPLISGHYDTTIGAKQDVASYQAIASDAGIAPEQFVFVSDVVAELDAARQAGMQTVLSVRPGNKKVDNADEHVCIGSFAEINFSETCV